jgi:hypothetical protein
LFGHFFHDTACWREIGFDWAEMGDVLWAKALESFSPGGHSLGWTLSTARVWRDRNAALFAARDDRARAAGETPMARPRFTDRQIARKVGQAYARWLEGRGPAQPPESTAEEFPPEAPPYAEVQPNVPADGYGTAQASVMPDESVGPIRTDTDADVLQLILTDGQQRFPNEMTPKARELKEALTRAKEVRYGPPNESGIRIPLLDTGRFRPELRDYVDQAAENLRVPKIMTLSAALMAVNTIVHGKADASGLELAGAPVDIMTPLSLWILPFVDSGRGKSRAVASVFRRIKEWQADGEERERKERLRHESKNKLLEKEAKKIEDAAEGSSPAEIDDAARQAAELRDQIRPFRSAWRVTRDDITPQAFVSQVAQTERRALAIVGAEPETLRKILGQHNRGEIDPGQYPAAFSGEPLDKTTMSGGEIDLPDCRGAFYVSAQPYMLQKMIDSEDLNSCGFMARALIFEILPEEYPPPGGMDENTLEMSPIAVSSQTQEAFEDKLQKLWYVPTLKKMKAASIGRGPAAADDPSLYEIERYSIKIGRDARLLWRLYKLDSERRAWKGGYGEPFKEFGSRVPELAKRLAANLHCYYHPCNFMEVPVATATVAEAIYLTEYFVARRELIHAIRGGVGAAGMLKSEELEKYMLQRGARGATESAIKRDPRFKARVNKGAFNVAALLKELAKDPGTVTMRPPKSGGRGRPCARWYHADFAPARPSGRPVPQGDG